MEFSSSCSNACFKIPKRKKGLLIFFLNLLLVRLLQNGLKKAQVLTLFLVEIGHAQTPEIGYERAGVIGGALRVYGHCPEAEADSFRLGVELVLM